MNIIITCETSIEDLVIDFIEVEGKNGHTYSLNWEESGIDRSEDSFTACYYKVMDGETPLDGRLAEFEDCKITAIGLYTEEDVTDEEISIVNFDFEEDVSSISYSDLPFTIAVADCDRT